MKLTLSKVKKNDCKNIFKIRNEKSVRLNSKNTSYINFNDHKKWFYKSYNLRKNYFFICKNKNNSIGYIRYIKNSFYFTISIAIKKTYRNIGLSNFIIKESEKFLPKSKLVISEVKNSNKKSINMFLNNGYINVAKIKKISIFAKFIIRENFKSRKKIINKIKKIRSKNNVNWMNILEIAFKKSPDEAAKIFKNINKTDNQIVKFSKELSSS